MGNTIKPLTTNWNLEKNNENQEKRLKPSINQLKPEKKCFFFTFCWLHWSAFEPWTCSLQGGHPNH